MLRRSFLSALGLAPISFLLAKELRPPLPKKLTIKSIPSGFRALDEITGGFKTGDLTVLAARPAMGKTGFVVSLTDFLITKTSLGVAYFSIESSKENITKRLLAKRTGIPLEKFRSGRFVPLDWPKIVDSSDALARAPLYIDDEAGTSPEQIRSKLEWLSGKIDLVVLDYFELLRPENKGESRAQEAEVMAQSLKQTARELNLPIIVLAQTRRACDTRTSRRPNLQDLRESTPLLVYSDLALFLYRDDYYTHNKSGKAEINVAFNRSGAIGVANLKWIPECIGFESV